MSIYTATLKLILLPIVFAIALPFFVFGFLYAWIGIAFNAGKVIGKDFLP